MRRQQGFTLIELMIVIAIITIIALIAIPNLLGSRLVANERSVICTLRTVAAAQAQFQARQIVDQNSNGKGEYGFLQELSGSAVPRGATLALDPGSLSVSLGNVNAAGLVTKSGYAYVMFLPGGAGAPIQEPAAGAPAAGNAADANLQETRWCCYAVPQALSNTGNRAFIINQEANVYSADNVGVQNYDLVNVAPLLANPNAAFTPGVANIDGRIANGPGLSQDGTLWTPAS